MNKEKIIGMGLGIILALLGAFGLINVDSVKQEVCSAQVAK